MILLYFFIGFLCIRFGVAFINFWNYLQRRDNKFKKGQGLDELISILIPAKNEEKNIIELLRSIQNQDYKRFEVWILDDQSNDNTYSLVEKFSKQDPRFQIVSGLDLPNHWLGKNYACYQLSQKAHGEYLLFLDADVTIHSGLIEDSLIRMKTHSLSLLSYFAVQEIKSWGEWLTVPLMNYFLLSFLPLNLVQSNKAPSLAASNGQFMLFNKKDYDHYQWHSQVKNQVAEDYEICKLIKKNDLLAETLLSKGNLRCRMYSNFEEAIEGFSKNTYALFSYNLAGILLFIGMISIIYLLPIFYFSWTSFLMILLLVLGIRILTSYSSGQSIIKNIIHHPLQIGIMVFICLRSVFQYYKGTRSWKGRLLNPVLLEAN